MMSENRSPQVSQHVTYFLLSFFIVPVSKCQGYIMMTTLGVPCFLLLYYQETRFYRNMCQGGAGNYRFKVSEKRPLKEKQQQQKKQKKKHPLTKCL